jgi:hypothetical protein
MFLNFNIQAVALPFIFRHKSEGTADIPFFKIVGSEGIRFSIPFFFPFSFRGRGWGWGQVLSLTPEPTRMAGWHRYMPRKTSA